MQEISNSLRERLAARQQPQTHPDPDTLTAYVEQVLPPAERSRIIEHLADCRDCREVVSLSLPQLEPAQSVVQVAAARRWWTPAYRWATVAATVAIAATLIIEKPWQTTAPLTPRPQQERAAAAAASQTSSTESAATDQTRSSTPQTTQETPGAPVRTRSTPNALALNGSSGAGATSANQSAGLTQDLRARAAHKSGVAGGAVGGLAENDRVVASRGPAIAPVVTSTQAETTQPVNRLADSEFVNRDAIQQAAAPQSKRKDVQAAGASALLPAAPEPQASAKDSATAAHKFVPPPLNATNTQNADAIVLAPPNVSPSASSAPSASENTLPKMAGVGIAKKVTSKVGESVKSAVRAVMEPTNPAAPPLAAQGFAGSAIAAPVRKTAEPQPGLRRELGQQVHWSITQDGKLVKSSDYSQWHEAYTQSPDLQFRVVVSEGRQVWAGANNATLVHSWNGGVNWETFKVPDTGDITSISIDDGWQVKTSNGQTFVSTDHGQTWVPLEQPK